MLRFLPLACLIAAPVCVTAQDQSGGARHLTLLGIPSATVAPGGSAFASLSYGTDRANTPEESDDGSLAFGIGLGDANNTIGVQLTTEITSLTDSFGDAGYFEVKAARRIAAGRTPLYLALQVSDLGGWGLSEENETSTDLILTGFHMLENGAPLMFTFGVGSNVRDDGTEPGAYAGLGIGLSRTFAASAAWYGEYGTIGVSYAPRASQNMSFTASVVDIGDVTGNRTGVFTFNYIIPKAFGG